MRLTFHSLRHFRGTMEYHKTKDILHVKYILGHRNIRNTLIYIDIERALWQGVPEESTTRVAHSVQEACELIEAGFEKADEYNDLHIYRKRK